MITAMAIGLITLLALYAMGLALSFRERCEGLAKQLRQLGGVPYYEDDEMRPAVELSPNRDGTWTARIFEVIFVGTRDQCVAWLRANGEEVLTRRSITWTGSRLASGGSSGAASSAWLSLSGPTRDDANDPCPTPNP